jgi:predicted glycosyltransferase
LPQHHGRDRPRVLLDVTHPAHVQLMGPIGRTLIERSVEVRVAGREKDVTAELLEGASLPYEIVSRAARHRTRARDAMELTLRVARLRGIVRRWRPQVILTRNPSGVLAGLAGPAWTVFDTDDGSSVGLHYRLAAPYADVVTSSVHDPEDHGPHHLRYPALKPHAWLHPDRRNADPGVMPRYGLDPGSPLIVVRWSRHDSSHDSGVRSLGPADRRAIVDLLGRHGTVLESSEGDPPRLLGSEGQQEVAARDFTPLLAAAACCVTDGQSVASEAAVLGVPTFRLSSFTGKVWYLAMLEARGLVRNFPRGQEQAFCEALTATLARLPQARSEAAARAARLNADSIDLTAWFTDRIVSLAGTPRGAPLRSDPSPVIP